MKILTFHLPSPYWQQTCDLRLKVFVEEQGVPEELEIDEYDQFSLHLIAVKNEKVIATLRLVFKKNTAKLGRLAVEKSERHKGVASQLMQYSVEYCHQQSCKMIELGAQVEAKEFYKKLGYQEKGDMFMDAGIDHVLMVKNIT